jgi:hypothetical protein
LSNFLKIGKKNYSSLISYLYENCSVMLGLQFRKGQDDQGVNGPTFCCEQTGLLITLSQIDAGCSGWWGKISVSLCLLDG